MNINVFTDQGLTALKLATMHDHINVVYLVEHGAQVDKINKEGKTALMYFRNQREKQSTQLQIVELLRSKGAKLDHIGDDGNTFLYHAINKRNLLLVHVVNEIMKPGKYTFVNE